MEIGCSIALTTFDVTCTAQTGNLRVNTATTGEDLDPDGYTITLDGANSQSIGINDQVTFTDLTPSNHPAQLTDIASNCTVIGANPRTVSVNAGGTAQTTFNVTCSAQTGDLQVNTATTGEDLDPDGYTITLDGANSQSIGINDQVTFTGLAASDHQVELNGVAGNCSVCGQNPRTINVPAGGTATTTFDVTCAAQAEVALWGVYETSFSGPSNLSNPFKDASGTVTFKGPSGLT